MWSLSQRKWQDARSAHGRGAGVTSLVWANPAAGPIFFFLVERAPKWKWSGALLLASICCVTFWMLRDYTLSETIIQTRFGTALQERPPGRPRINAWQQQAAPNG